MEKICTLQDLIDVLEHGHRFHISVVFYQRRTVDLFKLRFRNQIHSTPFCDAIKTKNGLNRCLQCKGKAIDKARTTRTPYGGLCVNGVYEFCYPVFHNDNLICIIFVGNIINDLDAFLEKSGLPSDSPLLETMEHNMDPRDCLRICSVIASFILMMVRQLPEPISSNQVNNAVASIKSYVDCYYYLDFSLSELAKVYHYNEKYLGMLFQQQIGMSFHTYLNYRRLMRAQLLLTQTNDSVLSISSAVGFNNVTYFNRLFRQQFNQTPSQYRNNNSQKNV